MQRVFDLSNDPIVRENSIHKEQIAWKDHVAWFEKAISDPDTKFFVGETAGGDFAGQVRFHRENGDWVVSISVSEQFRGLGAGGALLCSAMRQSGLRSFKALVKQENLSSGKMFDRSGYRMSGRTLQNGAVFDIWRYDHVFVIAEMSANHCGDKRLAREIIAAAKESGVDAVKLQTYTADTMTIDCKKDCFKISNGSIWDGRTFYDLYKEAYTPWEWQQELKEYADKIGIELFSTPFDKSSVDFLEGVGVSRYKIASFEAVDIPLVRYAASKGKPMIVSVGICSLEEMQDVIDACKSEGNEDVTLLKCTSAYPAKPEDMNLLTIPDMVRRFGQQGVKIGLSDHSMHVETSVAGVALGACVIEKHFTLDRSLGGPDAQFSLEPDEMKALVESVRRTEMLLGHAEYSVNAGNRQFARSLFVVKDMRKGEPFTEENIRSIRPGLGLPPKKFDEIVGRRARVDIERGTPLAIDMVEDCQ